MNNFYRLIIHFSLFALFHLQVSAQLPSRPNAYDENGNRTGKWIIRYDSAYTNIVETDDAASYYCLLELKHGKPIGQISCFYLSGIKQWEGRLLSLEPKIIHGKALFYHANGQIQEKVFYEFDTLQGSAVSYYDNGLLLSEGEILNGNRTGIWTYYHENGAFFGQIEYLDNQENGYSELYYPSGHLQQKGNWKQGKYQGLWETSHPNGQLKSKGIWDKDLRTGTWYFYFENGQLDQKSEYQDGVFHGLFTSFHPNGQLHKQGPFQEGKENGHFEMYHENGLLESKGDIINGLYEGNWVYYYPNGQKKSEGPFKESYTHGYWKYYKDTGVPDSECNLNMGHWDGEARFYHDNGVLKSIGVYANDLKQGEWENFNTEGELIGISTYVDEVLHGRFENYNEEAVLQQKGTLINAKKEGEWTFYHPNGQVSHFGNYQEDLENGGFTFYYENGQVWKKGTITDGWSGGHWKYYFEDGTVKSEGPFVSGKLHGEWKYYHENGELSAIGDYENGATVGIWTYYHDNGVLKSKGDENNDLQNGYWVYFNRNGQKESGGTWKNGKKHGEWMYYDSLENLTGTYTYHYNSQLNFSTMYDSAVLVSKRREHQEALKIAKVARKYFLEEYSKKHLMYTDVYGLYGNLYRNQQSYKKALKYFDKSLQHTLRHKADTSVWYVSYLQSKAATYNDAGMHEASIAVYEKAIELIRKRPGGELTKSYSDIVFLLSNTLKFAGRNQEAMDLLNSEQERQLQYADRQITIAENYLALTDFAYNLDMMSEAEQNIDALIAFDEANNMTDHWTYAPAFYYKGLILLETDEDSAMHFFQRSIELYIINKDTTFNGFFDSFINLGDYYYGLAKYDQSRDYYIEVLSRMEALEQYNNPLYLNAYVNYANQLWAESKIEDALEAYRHCLNIHEQTQSNNPSRLSEAHLGVALCLEVIGTNYYDEAEAHFQKAIAAVANESKYDRFYANSLLLYASFLRSSKVNIQQSNALLQQTLAYNANHGFAISTMSMHCHMNLGKNFYKIQQYDSSRHYLTLALDFMENDPSKNIQAYIETLRAIGDIYEDLEDYTKAQVCNLKALNAIKDHLGTAHRFYAISLNEVARNLSMQGVYPSAILYHRQVLDLQKTLFAQDNEQVITTMILLGAALRDNNDINESIKILEEAKQLFENKNDRSNSWYLTGLRHLTEAYEEDNRPKEAEDLMLTLLKIAKRIYPQSDIRYAQALSDLGSFYSRQWQYDLALYYKHQAVDLVNQYMGKTLKYASFINGLSWIHYNLGNYTTAIDLKEEAAEMYLSLMGESDDYIDAIYGLGEIYRALGQYQNAVDTYEKTQAIVIRKYGRFSMAMTSTLTEIGVTYWKWKQPNKALEQFEKVGNLYDSLGTDRSFYPSHYNQLGLVYFDMGAYEEARFHYEKALSLADSLSTETNASAYIYKNNLAHYHLYQENYETAEKLWLAVEQEVYAQSDEAVSRVTWLDNMAALYLAWGKMDKAEKYWTETIRILMDRIQKDFPFLSESGKAQFWNAYKQDFEYFNTYAITAAANGNTKALGQMYDNQLQTKSILLSTSSKERRRILSSGDSTLISTYQQYVRLKENLVKYYGYTPNQLTTENIDLTALERESARFEKALSIDANALRNEEKPTSWKDIQKNLKPGEAAVEIIRFRYFHKIVTDSVLYAALILTPDTKTQPKLVMLSNGRELEEKYVKAYRNSIQYQINETDSYQRFWGQIDAALSGIHTIHFSPDGVYNQLNVGTLLKPNGTYVGDNYDIRLLTSTRDLTLAKAKKVSKIQPFGFLFGYPKYDLEHESIEEALIERGITRNTTLDRDTDLSRIAFVELPGTKTETETITDLLINQNWGASLFLANDALEEELKRVDNPTLLHIATHGFFLDNVANSKDHMELGIRADVSSVNPLLRSGLLLAGATQTARGHHQNRIENGIFTAYEAMNLNLLDTELVVLSACETGRGEIRNGEGVYGLQRAFQIAGADAIVMSLWKVDDTATQLLMTSFYQAWLAGNTKALALSLAQNKVKAQYPHPYYWGAFVMIGE